MFDVGKNSVYIAPEAEKFGVEIDASSTSLFNECGKLSVCQIARHITDGLRV